MEQVYAVSKPGSIVHVKTPHFTNNNAWVGPTPNRPFSAFTFNDYFRSTGQYSYYKDDDFEVIDIQIRFELAKTISWNIFGR